MLRVLVPFKSGWQAKSDNKCLLRIKTGRKTCTASTSRCPIQSLWTGAYHQEPATTPYSCHVVLTDRSMFSLNLSLIQIPTRTSVTNCNHKHGLMLTCTKWCRHVQVRPHCFILTEAGSCRLELAYFAVKISKNRLVCKNAVALAYYGRCRLPVMGSCFGNIPKTMGQRGMLEVHAFSMDGALYMTATTDR